MWLHHNIPNILDDFPWVLQCLLLTFGCSPMMKLHLGLPHLSAHVQADAAQAKLPCAGPAPLYEDPRPRGKSNWGFARAMANFCFAAMGFVLLTWAVTSPALWDISDPFQVPLQCLLAELSDSSCNSQAPVNVAPAKTILNCISVSNKYSIASSLKTQNWWKETQ